MKWLMIPLIMAALVGCTINILQTVTGEDALIDSDANDLDQPRVQGDLEVGEEADIRTSDRAGAVRPRIQSPEVELKFK